MSTLACYDCDLPYGGPHWVEAVVANHIWNKHLSPTRNEGGILCINCMAKRASRAGLSNVRVRLTAGPFVTGGATAAILDSGPSHLARIEAFGHDPAEGRDREATKAGIAPKSVERGERK